MCGLLLEIVSDVICGSTQLDDFEQARDDALAESSKLKQQLQQSLNRIESLEGNHKSDLKQLVTISARLHQSQTVLAVISCHSATVHHLRSAADIV